MVASAKKYFWGYKENESCAFIAFCYTDFVEQKACTLTEQIRELLSRFTLCIGKTGNFHLVIFKN
jgi:hypothetical protein